MRNPNTDKNTGLKKGSWSHEEDQMLISYISRYGIWNWSQMPRFAGLLRNGKSCRLRWMNYLNPNIKRGNFSKEEEEVVLRFHAVLGNKWSAIASRLPGRTDNEVKNHWHAHLKKRVTRYNKTAEDDDNNTQQPAANIRISENVESNCITSNDHDIWNSCYDTGSPGTVDDLEHFWQQLWSFENLDHGNNID